MGVKPLRASDLLRIVQLLAPGSHCGWCAWMP